MQVHPLDNMCVGGGGGLGWVRAFGRARDVSKL